MQVPTPTHDFDRHVRLDGCLNFRDLGGYPNRAGRQVRTGKVFRSDALHLLSERDIRRLCDDLRVADVIDLRSSAEVRADGRGPIADEPIRIHHLPLFDGGPAEANDERIRDINLADRYFLLAEFAMEPIARVISTLAAAPEAAVYHCAAGKDRTGVVSALLLALLDVEEEIIVADYALTGHALDQIIERLYASEGYRTMFEALPPDTLHANPDTMRSFLRQLHQRHGSVEGYARDAGIGEDTLEQLRQSLLA